MSTDPALPHREPPGVGHEAKTVHVSTRPRSPAVVGLALSCSPNCTVSVAWAAVSVFVAVLLIDLWCGFGGLMSSLR